MKLIRNVWWYIFIIVLGCYNIYAFLASDYHLNIGQMALGTVLISLGVIGIATLDDEEKKEKGGKPYTYTKVVHKWDEVLHIFRGSMEVFEIELRIRYQKEVGCPKNICVDKKEIYEYFGEHQMMELAVEYLNEYKNSGIELFSNSDDGYLIKIPNKVDKYVDK